MPYHHALLRRGISKREEEEDCEPSLHQGMEYTGAVGVRLLEIIEESTHRYEVQVSALDLAVTDMDERVQDSEWRLVNLRGVEGVAQEVWQMAMVARDATENIQAMRDWVSNLEGRMEDAEVVAMEVDERFSEVENKINELKLDMMMLVTRRKSQGQDLQWIRDVVVDQQGLIIQLQDQIDLLREQVLALQHGAANPIIVEEYELETDLDSSSEGVEVMDEDNDEVVMYYLAPPRLLVLVRIRSTVLTQPGTLVSFRGMFIYSLFDFWKLRIFQCFPFPENSGTPTFPISGNSGLRCFPRFSYYVILLVSCLRPSLVTPSAVGNTSLSPDPQFPLALLYCFCLCNSDPILCTQNNSIPLLSYKYLYSVPRLSRIKITIPTTIMSSTSFLVPLSS